MIRTNKKTKDSQILDIKPEVKGINFTLRDMLGIPHQFERDNAGSGHENVFKMQSQMSDPKMLSSSKFGDSMINIGKWKEVLDNKFLQKTQFYITKNGLVNAK